MRFNEDVFDPDNDGDIDIPGSSADIDMDAVDLAEDDYAEVEMVVAEPTKVTDVDGSVVIVSPGDTVTIKSESIKRIKQ